MSRGFDPDFRSDAERLDAILDIQHATAIRLLGHLVDDFLHESFTVEDVKEGFDALVGRRTSEAHFERLDLHLAYLVKRGILDFDPATGEYGVNPNADEVGTYISS